jgi:hypothetical protein
LEAALLTDGASEIVHPENESIVAYFKANSVHDTQTDTYRLHARPDLTAELHDVIAETDIPGTRIRTGSMYGWPVVANQDGVVFAWTGGTSDVFLRIKGDKADGACKDGARIDPTYPPDWLNFYIARLGQNWREVLKRWVKIAYEDTVALH